MKVTFSIELEIDIETVIKYLSDNGMILDSTEESLEHYISEVLERDFDCSDFGAIISCSAKLAT
jgi:hypothetical protein